MQDLLGLGFVDQMYIGQIKIFEHEFVQRVCFTQICYKGQNSAKFNQPTDKR